MYLKSLSLVNFRNYESNDINFSDKLNLVYGLNAQGKTNLLEAIYLICLGRSFRMAQNQEMIEYERDFFTVEGNLVLDNQIGKTVVLRYIRDGKKEFSIDRKRLKSHSELIGQFPVVIMAPDEFKITTGGPSERRRFIDILLSQVSISYLKNLQEYHRVLKQRNKILNDIKSGLSVSDGTLHPWTDSLIEKGCKIIQARVAFVAEFSLLLNSNYKKYSETGDELQIVIKERSPENSVPEYRQQLTDEFKGIERKEKILGRTLAGPHRDDIVFELNGRDLRKYGSRGEHKSALISLKLAEFKYMQSKKEEKPFLLLDDCYSELDMAREEKVFESLLNLGQIFLTSPKPHSVFESAKFAPAEVSRFEILQGQIRNV